MKRQATDWEKYLQNTYDDKGSKIYKDFLKLNDKKTTQKTGKRLPHRRSYTDVKWAHENRLNIIFLGSWKLK